MSTAGRPEPSTPAASDVAAGLREASLARIVAAPDGDALAATGLLADALDAVETPYQATVARAPSDASRATDADFTVSIGRSDPDADVVLGLDEPASLVAYDASADADPKLAVAGTIAAGRVPTGTPLDDAADDLDRRPGVAIPVPDAADGLAHSTLVHAPFSGDVDAAAKLLPDEDAGRLLASRVALAVAGDDDATTRAAEAVERLCRPYAGGPFETLGGYADVLDAVARHRPGLGVSLVLGHADAEPVLDAWRAHARGAHAAVRSATTGRYDGLFVARCDGDAPIRTVARLVRDYRSPEPVVLVVGPEAAALAVTDEAAVDSALHDAAASLGGESITTRDGGFARFDAEPTEFVAAFREAR